MNDQFINTSIGNSINKHKYNKCYSYWILIATCTANDSDFDENDDAVLVAVVTQATSSNTLIGLDNDDDHEKRRRWVCTEKD